MSPASAIYEGRIRHRRYGAAEHRFTYSLFMMYLDLAEAPSLFARTLFWSTGRFSLAWFRRRDHLGDPGQPLDEAVRDLVAERGRARPAGPIRLLTHLRYFGYCFNPVSFYFCYDRSGSSVETIVAEVHNTPWGERHCYVLEGAPGALAFSVPKEFHVSPFLDMKLTYRWWFREPGRRIVTHMQALAGTERVFDATMDLERREITSRALASVLVRYPVMTGKVIAAIYMQAARLWLKGARFYPHPAQKTDAAEDGSPQDRHDRGAEPRPERNVELRARSPEPQHRKAAPDRNAEPEDRSSEPQHRNAEPDRSSEPEDRSSEPQHRNAEPDRSSEPQSVWSNDRDQDGRLDRQPGRSPELPAHDPQGRDASARRGAKP